jgi:hypothetical protein
VTESRVSDEQLRAWMAEGKGAKSIARLCGLSVATIKERVARLRGRDNPPDAAADGEQEIASEIAPRITSLEELLRQSKTDLTKWYVERHVINKWEVGAKMATGTLSFKDGVMSGHITRGGVVIKPLWQIKAWLKPVARDVTLARDVWAEMLTTWEKRTAKAHPAIKASGRLLRLVNPFDVHLGKLAYAPETGSNYDLKLATQTFRHCRDELLARTGSLPIERTVIPLGNDYFHYDNLASTTTGGTQQDSDTRFHKMFATGIELAVETVEMAAATGPVTVLIVPGNHDRLSAFTLGCVLEAQFRKDKRVTIDNAPTLRKYHRYGVNLLGFTHGSEEKQQDLAVIMATECEWWSQTAHREWHVGHVHKMKGMFGDSIRGVRIRVMPSIAATDAWHASKGYKDRRAMEAYLYDREKGYAGHFSSNVDTPLSAAA